MTRVHVGGAYGRRLGKACESAGVADAGGYETTDENFPEFVSLAAFVVAAL
jgi:hypothetical protein